MVELEANKQGNPEKWVPTLYNNHSAWYAQRWITSAQLPVAAIDFHSLQAPSSAKVLQIAHLYALLFVQALCLILAFHFKLL